MTARQVAIKAGLNNQVVIDGQDFTEQVTFIAFQHEPGKTVPVVTLGTTGELDLEGEMEVVVASSNQGEWLRMFLESLDLKKFEEEVLEWSDIERPNGFVRSVFEKLKQEANNVD
jgi:CHAT domain-containing protein